MLNDGAKRQLPSSFKLQQPAKKQSVHFLRLFTCFLAIVFSLSPARAQLTVNTVAGGGVEDGSPATSAALTLPHFAAYDTSGNLYVTDSFANRIRKVSTSGIITTIAGNGISGYSGDGGPASSAMVNYPIGITLDTSGNIYFVDSGNQRVRKIDTGGNISTIAGTGKAGFKGDGGPATSAELKNPWGLAFDNNGDLFISDAGNERVRVVDTAGIIKTFAGNGKAGYSGDGGKATKAELNFPYGLVADSSGNLYISDLNNSRVRLVNSKGTISTLAGTGTTFPCNGSGGPATSANIGEPTGLLISGGSLLIASEECSAIQSVDLASNIINTVAGTQNDSGYNGDGLAALSTEFQGPSDVLLDPSGDTVIVDRGNNRVRTVNAVTQTVNTIAGGFIGDGGEGTDANLNLPLGFGFDPNNNLYIADSFNHRVRELTASGIISTIAGTGISNYTGDGGAATSATLYLPYAAAADGSGNVFIADQVGLVIRKVSSSGIISTFSVGECYDGAAPFCDLVDLVTDSSGNIYGADDVFCAVWQITPGGTVNLIAGDPTASSPCGYNSDGIPATQALLNSPSGVAVDSSDNVYIADQSNNRIRFVSHSTGLITTVAGDGKAGFSGDGGRATHAKLNSPSAVAVDQNGNLYIADLGNARVRSVNSSGTIETYAGTGSFYGYNGNGLAATATNFDYLVGLAVNSDGVVYVLDYEQYRAREIN
jgi:sugar lactone lactonase YvrE